MTYKCSSCDQVSEQAGNCPHCNVPMNEEAVSINEETTTTEAAEPQESPDSE